MSNSILSPTSSQVNNLTKRQRSQIDELLVQYPAITSHCVRSCYEYYYYARNWFVFIEIDATPTTSRKEVTITRCDHSWTAATKAQAIRRYIEEKQGGAS